MKTMKKMMTLLAVFGLVLALAGEANAWLIGVDIYVNTKATVTEEVTATHFIGNLKDPAQNSTDDQIGVWDNGAASANWWNYVGQVSTRRWEATGLRDADGNVTGVSVLHVQPGDGWIYYNIGTSFDDLTRDASGLGGTLTTTISGLDVGSPYRVIVYHCKNKDMPETVTINSQATIAYTGDIANPGYQDAINGMTDSSFWYFEDVAADANGKLIISTGGAGWNNIAGFQVRTPPPPPAGTLFIVR